MRNGARLVFEQRHDHVKDGEQHAGTAAYALYALHRAFMLPDSFFQQVQSAGLAYAKQCVHLAFEGA